MMNKEITISQEEIRALIKLLLFVKFEINDEELEIFQGSTAINSIIKKILEVDDLGEIITKRYKLISDVFLKDQIDFYKESPMFNNFSIEQKVSYIHNMLFPYEIANEKIIDLI
ncbi:MULTISPECIES: hypothetical protein [unclassified Myroides]|uniref:hypothetical protein n=1 Tax=unclassified Myroides TaxID=2642485 RepID=UPI003D2F5A0A